MCSCVCPSSSFSHQAACDGAEGVPTIDVESGVPAVPDVAKLSIILAFFRAQLTLHRIAQLEKQVRVHVTSIFRPLPSFSGDTSA